MRGVRPTGCPKRTDFTVVTLGVKDLQTLYNLIICRTPRSGSSTQRDNGERLSARRRREEVHKEEDLALDLRSSDDTGLSLSKMKKIESARSAWRQKEQSKLEESWMSLDMFERHQRGRLSMDLQGTARSKYYLHFSNTRDTS